MARSAISLRCIDLAGIGGTPDGRRAPPAPLHLTYTCRRDA